MVETIFAYAFTLIIYAFQICIFLLIASLMPFLLYKEQKKKSVFIRWFIIFLLVEFLCLVRVAYNPFFICPEEYREFILEDDQRAIIRLNSGVYSLRIPVIPVCIIVKYADTDRIVVETNYIWYGKTEMTMTISNNEFYFTHDLY